MEQCLQNVVNSLLIAIFALNILQLFSVPEMKVCLTYDVVAKANSQHAQRGNPWSPFKSLILISPIQRLFCAFDLLELFFLKNLIFKRSSRFYLHNLF